MRLDTIAECVTTGSLLVDSQYRWADGQERHLAGTRSGKNRGGRVVVERREAAVAEHAGDVGVEHRARAAAPAQTGHLEAVGRARRRRAGVAHQGQREVVCLPGSPRARA